MTSGDCFSTLVGRIQSTDTEMSNFENHANEIEIRLSKAFKVKEIKKIGSHTRGTDISKFSDLDLLCVVAIDDFRWGNNLVTSDTILEKFRQELKARYPETEIGKDGQSIVVSFSDGTNIDVVPAIFDGINSYKKANYLIPNGNGNWLGTSPDAHSNYIEGIHSASGYKFKYLIQLIKFWRECRVPRIFLSSFHIELLFATYETFSGVKSYGQCMYDAFDLLCSRGCAGLQDPLGISGIVLAANSATKKNQVYDAVSIARDRAYKALNAETKGSNVDARYYWNLIFNGRFPS
jgi:predicted nucleotidyltransferase